jgi:hypothetical protein
MDVAPNQNNKSAAELHPAPDTRLDACAVAPDSVRRAGTACYVT